MPKLDFMILADYARTDGGVMHIMAAGVDTINAPSVPFGKQLAVAVRFVVDHEDVPGKVHQLGLIFADDDKVLATVGGHLAIPDRPDGLPIHWKVGLALALPIGLPFPSFGDYSLTLTLDEKELHSVDLRVIQAGFPS